MSAEELFDVVNDQDEVLAQARRSEVHRQGLKHRAAHVLVFNRAGQVLLQKRSMAKDCFPGAWDSSAAGHLAPGETYEACALRELNEELGLQLAGAALTPLFKLPASPLTGQEFCWVYCCASEGPFVPHPEEIERVAWFTPFEVDQLLASAPANCASSFVLIWQRLQWRP